MVQYLNLNKKKKCPLLLFIPLFFLWIQSISFAESLPFIDVNSKVSYYEALKIGYGSGVIHGISNNLYKPEDPVTHAQVIKLAACIDELRKKGSISFRQTSPWYQTYVDYAKEQGWITSDLQWEDAATNAEYMKIFAMLLSDEETQKNDIPNDAIPDVPSTHPSADAIYRLYRAGVVIGAEETHHCKPDDMVKRGEIVTVIARILKVDRRIDMSMNRNQPEKKADIQIIQQPPLYMIIYAMGKAQTCEVNAEGTDLNYQWQRSDLGKDHWVDLYENPPFYKGTKTNILYLSDPGIRITNFGWISDFRCQITDKNGQVAFTDIMRVFSSPHKTAEGHRPPVLMLFEKKIRGQVHQYSVIAGGLRGSVLSYQWQYRTSSGEWVNETDGTHKAEENILENATKGETSIIQYKITGSNTPTMLKEIQGDTPIQEKIYRCIIQDEKGNKVIADELY